MRTVSIEKLIELQSRPDQIRNICILAHVDHGKTTLADSLVAANGIISSRMVGKLRYMDSRPDEQERGITMKSSAIALYHSYENKDYLINLIDSPGHIDFCGEVSTATRMCDGALIIVDVVEGVCPQTHAVLRQAWREGIRPLLVLNKIDRLITELKMTTAEAYRQLERVLEEVNALAGNLFLSKCIEEIDNQENAKGRERRITSGDDGEKSIIDRETNDDDIYFAPESGNVLFASAADGWGFRLENFVKFCHQKTGLDETSIRQGLWGDFYLDAKSKSIKKGAFDCGKKPLFVQIILDTVWTAYQAILIKKDKEMIEKIIKSLNIAKLPPSRQQDSRIHLQSVMSQWLPLADSVLSAVCQLLPSPDQMIDERAVELMCSGLDPRSQFENLSDEVKKMKKFIRKCSSDDEAPVIIFVAKMFPVEKNQLPENRRKPLTAEQLQQMRIARQQQQQEQKKVQFADGVETAVFDIDEAIDSKETSTENGVNECPYTFMAFARVFSGTVVAGQRLYLASPNSNNRSTVDVEPPSILIDRLYLMMGRELEAIDRAKAGNVIAIGGLEDVIFKTATLSSTPTCPPLAVLRFYAHPIVRCSVEPAHPIDMPKLVRALKLLNQTDPTVKTFVQDTGEHVLVTAGEVHLQRCLADLRERFSDIELNVSEPIIPFHESIVTSPMSAGDSGSIEIKTSNKRVTFKIRAKQLPSTVIDLLDRYDLLLKNIDLLGDGDSQLEKFRDEMTKVLDDEWKGACDRLWAFGPKKARSNILLNCVSTYGNRPSFWNHPGPSQLRDFDQSVVSGFQLRCQSGPLCDEPMRGVCFILDEWTEIQEPDRTDSYGPMSGQIIAAVKEGCKLAFQAQSQRLSMAMYSCLIQATGEVLGRVYAVLSKRGGRVLKEDVKEGTNLFEIEATLPVVESFGFADEIRTRTSGLASPQLVFSHWEILDLDPFWVPSTEEELSHYGDKSDTENRALKYMNGVRRRKGLSIDEKTVEHAEKQRTLARKV